MVRAPLPKKPGRKDGPPVLVGSTWMPSFYGYDGHGSVRFLASTAGVATDTYQFDAFGMPIASTGTTPNNYVFSGEPFYQNIGLYHLRARDYNPATGRFETMDPVEGNILDPKTIQKYVYTANNPVNNVDPSGHGSVENAELLVGLSFLRTKTPAMFNEELFHHLPTFAAEQVHSGRFAFHIAECDNEVLGEVANILEDPLSYQADPELSNKFIKCILIAYRKHLIVF